MPELLINSLRGGLNDTDPPASLDDNQATLAENIDLDRSTLGGKRLGSTAISLTSANLAAKVVWLFRHTPSSDETAAELWAVSVNGSTVALCRKTTAWSNVSLVSPDLIPASIEQFNIEAQSLHGKMFFACPTVDGSAVPVDRLHVWDGTNFRRVGLAEPAAPTAADTGSGSFTGTRYYRVRYTVQSGGTTLLRSEPSAVLTKAPSGSGTGLVVTKPAALSESCTHWELEASTDNANFYRIATTVVGTTTVTDSVAYATGYAASGTLSEDTGDYEVPWSAKYLAADEDRLLFAGSWVNASYASRVGWTPVNGDTGVGNDERMPVDTDNFVDLDGYDGGEITDLAGPLNGYIYAFKRSAIYKLVRTGNRAQAYQAIQLTKTKGALPRTVVEGVDEQGNPSLYFLDPKTGPHRVGSNGIEQVGGDIAATWATVNLDATLVAHSLFYPDKQQLWIWVATGSATTPDVKLVGHVRHMRRGPQGVRGGWVKHTGPSAAAYASTLFAEDIDDNNARSLQLKPFIGVAHATNIIQIADTGTTDNSTTFQGRIRTKPFLVGNLLRKAGVMAAALMAEAASGVTVYVTLMRDYGLETKQCSAVLTASGSETRVVKLLDDAALSELNTLQIELGDSAASSASWTLDALALKIRAEEGA